MRGGCESESGRGQSCRFGNAVDLPGATYSSCFFSALVSTVGACVGRIGSRALGGFESVSRR